MLCFDLDYLTKTHDIYIFCLSNTKMITRIANNIILLSLL